MHIKNSLSKLGDTAKEWAIKSNWKKEDVEQVATIVLGAGLLVAAVSSRKSLIGAAIHVGVVYALKNQAMKNLEYRDHIMGLNEEGLK